MATTEADGRLYSVGYEGFTLAGLVENLTQHRVELVVDVRLNAVSRKPGFAKRRLAEALAAAGIEYVHVPELGNPMDNREPFRSPATIDQGRAVVRARLEGESRGAVEELLAAARSRRVAMLCLERREDACHRSVIVDVLRERAPDLRIVPVL